MNTKRNYKLLGMLLSSMIAFTGLSNAKVKCHNFKLKKIVLAISPEMVENGSLTASAKQNFQNKIIHKLTKKRKWNRKFKFVVNFEEIQAEFQPVFVSVLNDIAGIIQTLPNTTTKKLRKIRETSILYGNISQDGLTETNNIVENFPKLRNLKFKFGKVVNNPNLAVFKNPNKISFEKVVFVLFQQADPNKIIIKHEWLVDPNNSMFELTPSAMLEISNKLNTLTEVIISLEDLICRPYYISSTSAADRVTAGIFKSLKDNLLHTNYPNITKLTIEYAISINDVWSDNYPNYEEAYMATFMSTRLINLEEFILQNSLLRKIHDVNLNNYDYKLRKLAIYMNNDYPFLGSTAEFVFGYNKYGGQPVFLSDNRGLQVIDIKGNGSTVVKLQKLAESLGWCKNITPDLLNITAHYSDFPTTEYLFNIFVVGYFKGTHPGAQLDFQNNTPAFANNANNPGL